MRRKYKFKDRQKIRPYLGGIRYLHAVSDAKRIINDVYSMAGLDPALIYGKRKGLKNDVVHVSFVAQAVIYKCTRLNPAQIGDILLKDRTGVMYAIAGALYMAGSSNPHYKRIKELYNSALEKHQP